LTAQRFLLIALKQELIKYKGLQVAPAELEALLLTHPKILDAAVVGVDCARYRSATSLCCSGGDITEQDIKDFVKKHVADYKQLRGASYSWMSFRRVHPGRYYGKI